MPLDRLHAPYNFVPLSRCVFEPDWAPQVSHDQPLEDGLSGTVDFTVTAHSPLCIGGKQERPDKDSPGTVRFLRLPDGTPAIPGTSLKGMIRNVLEIACFGKMQLIDDRRFGLRDLTGAAKDAYQRRMSAGSYAGWLSFDGDKWTITPCDYGRITHSDIAKLGGIRERDLSSPRLSAMDKYRAWRGGKRLDSLAIKVRARQMRDSSRPGSIECVPPNQEGPGDIRRGTLVFTGQPNTKKKREFVFFAEEREPLPVRTEVMQAFLDIHHPTGSSASDNSNEKERQQDSAEWLYWREHLFKRGGRVPVFYLRDNSDVIDTFGLAMMFKAASTYKTHELRVPAGENMADPHAKLDDYDLPELIFGRVHKEPNKSLRGRVSVGTAKLTNGTETELSTGDPLILGAPKASYFPAYLRQPPDPDQPWRLRPGENYDTYMDEGAELAGWKRYPARDGTRVKVPALNVSNRGNRKVQGCLETLSGGDGKAPGFEGRLRFHNLRPVELGAIGWALTWGGDSRLRHGLGLGKPFGFGQVSIAITASEIIENIPNKTTTTLADCLESFRSEMEDWAKRTADASDLSQGWENSLQVQRLRSMADPRQASRWEGELRYLELDPKARPRPVNEFVDAKRQRLVLAPYGDVRLERLRSSPTGNSFSSSMRQRRGAVRRDPAKAEAKAHTPSRDPNVVWPPGTSVLFAEEQGVLAEPLTRGMVEVEVSFDGEVELVPVNELHLPKNGPP